MDQIRKDGSLWADRHQMPMLSEGFPRFCHKRQWQRLYCPLAMTRVLYLLSLFMCVHSLSKVSLHSIRFYPSLISVLALIFSGQFLIQVYMSRDELRRWRVVPDLQSIDNYCENENFGKIFSLLFENLKHKYNWFWAHICNNGFSRSEIGSKEGRNAFRLQKNLIWETISAGIHTFSGHLLKFQSQSTNSEGRAMTDPQY